MKQKQYTIRDMIRRKLSHTGGISWLIPVLAVLVVILAVAVVLPWIQSNREQAEVYACNVSMKTAQEMLDVMFLTNPSMSAQEAIAGVQEKAELCPSGGDFFLVSGGFNAPYVAVCGLHSSDEKLCTRLCADKAFNQVQSALHTAWILSDPIPERISVTINGSVFTAERVREDPGIRHGTFSTPGYRGTVIFYGMEEDETASDPAQTSGGNYAFWFCYADENYCANWSGGLWSGDSYE